MNPLHSLAHVCKQPLSGQCIVKLCFMSRHKDTAGRSGTKWVSMLYGCSISYTCLPPASSFEVAVCNTRWSCDSRQKNNKHIVHCVTAASSSTDSLSYQSLPFHASVEAFRCCDQHSLIKYSHCQSVFDNYISACIYATT